MIDEDRKGRVETRERMNEFNALTVSVINRITVVIIKRNKSHHSSFIRVISQDSKWMGGNSEIAKVKLGRVGG